MICAWWDWEGMVHWKMLERHPHQQGQTIILHDNTRPHVAQVIKAALQELKWEVLQHLPYSLNLAPMDYYLFCSLSNHMRGVTFENEEDLKNWLNKFFDTRPGDFWQNSIDKLVKRWEEVIKSNEDNLLIYSHNFSFLFK